MRRFLIAIALLSAGCSPAAKEPHPYPVKMKIDFDRKCPLRDRLCACSWERITQDLTPIEYDEAMSRFASTGVMDPRLTRARSECLDKV